MAEILKNLWTDDEDTQKDKYLTFLIGSEVYGIGIGTVTEIIGIQPLTEIPEMPEYIKGIINLRGRIIPVLDVRLRFKKPALAYNDRTCIIVVNIRAVAVGLIVDSVVEVLNIPESDIVPPPQIGREGSHRYLRAIGKQGDTVKLLLDCEKLLSLETTESLDALGS